MLLPFTHEGRPIGTSVEVVILYNENRRLRNVKQGFDAYECLPVIHYSVCYTLPQLLPRAADRQPIVSTRRSRPAQQNLRVAVVFWYELDTRKSYLGDRDFRSSFSSLVLVVAGDAYLH